MLGQINCAAFNMHSPKVLLDRKLNNIEGNFLKS